MTVGFHCWQTTVTASPPTFHAKRHAAEEAAAMVRNGSVKANPVFGRGESAMFNAAISESDVNHTLAYNIPAISSATGKMPAIKGKSETFNLNLNSSRFKSNQWGRNHPDYKQRWLHSDAKNMAFAMFMMSMHGWLSMTSFERAIVYGAKILTTYVIVDDRGQPVPDAKVHIWLDLELHKDGGEVYYGYTDSDGRYLLDGKTTGVVRYSFVKDGYCETQEDLHLTRVDDERNAVRDGKWQPYGQTRRVVLKRIVNPTAKPFHYGDMPVPVFGQWMGFDLEKFDLCMPYGKGLHEDILLRYVLKRDDLVRGKTYASMEMTFTNNSYGGAYVLKKDCWSEFKSCYVADTNNPFAIKTFKCEVSRTREEIFKRDNFPEDSYIVFRTRTTVDGDGKLVSAHYGKIYGGWDYPRQLHFGGTLFNSNPNDSNLEEEDAAIRARLHVKGMRERGELK